MTARAERERAEIETQTAAYLAAGGQITKLGNTLPKVREMEMRNGRPCYRDTEKFSSQRRGGTTSTRRKIDEPSKQTTLDSALLHGLKFGESM